MKKQFLNNTVLVICLSFVLNSFSTLVWANGDIKFKNKLIVIYKTSSNLREKGLGTTSLGTLPFESVLGNVIKKIIKGGKINPNYRFQESSEDIAFVESELQELDSYIVKVNNAEVIDLLKQGLENENGVLRVSKDFEVFFDETVSVKNQISCQSNPELLPNDPYNLENWHYERTGLTKVWNDTCNCPSKIPLNKCNVKEHPEFCNVGDPNIVIAILDNGFSAGTQTGTIAHPDLIDRIDVTVSRSVVSGSDPFDFDSSDEPSSKVIFDHGTASANSAIANANNGKSHAGINWNSKIWAIRVGRGASASFSDILSGIDYVLQRARELNIHHFIINISYGSGECNKHLAQEIELFSGINVTNKGGLITLSSGNDGCFQDFKDIAPNVLVVGATVGGGPCGNVDVAGYSNYGTLTDIFSPSGFVVDNRDTRIQEFKLGKLAIHGTSFSAPSLAGYASLLWSKYPNLSSSEVEKILKVSSFNSLGLFANIQNKEKIFKSQSAQVQIDDAISLKSQILNLIITTNPPGEKQDLYAQTNNELTIAATIPNSDEKLSLDALNLPEGAIFEKISGIGSISQKLLWSPGESQVNNKFQITFIVQNSQEKIIGYKKILFSILEKPENNPPIVNAGLGKTVRPKEVIKFEDATAFDTDGDKLTYEWTLVESPIKVIRINPWRLNQAGFYAHGTDKGLVDIKFKLTVSDGTNTVSDEVIYTVKNHAPIADTGPDKRVRRNTLIHIGSLKSIDPDGDPLKFTWVQINGPKVELSDPNAQFPFFITPDELTTEGNEIIFRLTVEDDYGGSAQDDDYTYVVR